MQTLWTEGKSKENTVKAFSFHCLRSLNWSRNNDGTRSNKVKKQKIHPFRFSSSRMINWFCSLLPLLTAVGSGYSLWDMWVICFLSH